MCSKLHVVYSNALSNMQQCLSGGFANRQAVCAEEDRRKEGRAGVRWSRAARRTQLAASHCQEQEAMPDKKACRMRGH
eukprot:4562698-Pleurochrysis_carterae.AAC.2